MADLTRFYRNRVIYDLTDYQEADFDDRVLLCIPRFAWLQARNLMRGYGLRLNAYAATYESGGYYPPDAALFDKIDFSISDFLAEDDMCQDLTDALVSIKDAILLLQDCSSTCGGAGSFGAGTEDEAESTFVDDGENYPDGFANRAAYDTYKCDVANAIIYQIRTDVNWMKTGTVIGIAATALAFTLFTPIPLDDIIALLGFAVALSVEAALVGAATAIVAAIDADEDAYVCALFSGTTPGYAKAQLQELFDNDLTTTENALVNYWVNNVAFNALFEKSATYEQVSGTMSVDCGDCGCPSWGTLWTVISRDATSALIESQEAPADDFLYASVHCPDVYAPGGAGGPWGPYCGSGESYTVEDAAGTPPNLYATFNDDGDEIIPVWTAWPGSYTGNARAIFFKRTSTVDRFRMQFDFT